MYIRILYKTTYICPRQYCKNILEDTTTYNRGFKIFKRKKKRVSHLAFDIPNVCVGGMSEAARQGMVGVVARVLLRENVCTDIHEANLTQHERVC